MKYLIPIQTHLGFLEASSFLPSSSPPSKTSLSLLPRPKAKQKRKKQIIIPKNDPHDDEMSLYRQIIFRTHKCSILLPHFLQIIRMRRRRGSSFKHHREEDFEKKKKKKRETSRSFEPAVASFFFSCLSCKVLINN